MTELQKLQNVFDEIGVVYVVQTNKENDDINPKHTALFTEDFLFVFDTKTGIFFDTRNLSNE